MKTTSPQYPILQKQRRGLVQTFLCIHLQRIAFDEDLVCSSDAALGCISGIPEVREGAKVMAKAETRSATARAPRGTKPVAQAFLTALETIPEASRSAVAKAAQALIRDELKNRRDKLKAAAAKEKARRPVPAKRAPKSPASPETAEPVPEQAASKRRSRKQADARAAAA